MVQSIGNEQNKDNPLMPKGDNVNLEQGHSSRQDSRYKPMTTSGLEPEDEPIRKKGLGDINWTSFLINIVIALVVVMMMNSFFMPVVGKKVYQADITRLETDLVAMRATDTDLTNKIETLENNNKALEDKVTAQLSTTLKEIDNKIAALENNINQKLSGYITSETVDTKIQNSMVELRTEINSVATSLTALSGKIDSQIETKITAQLTDLTNRIIKLETPQQPTSSGLTVKLTRTIDTLIPVDNPSTDLSANTSLLQASFKIVITNTSTINFEDVILNIYLQTETIPNITKRTLTSTPSMSWYTPGWFSYEAEYINSWGLSVDAGKSKTIYFTLTIQGNDATPYTTGYGYQVDAEVAN